MTVVHRVSLDRPDQAPHGVCIYVGCPKSGKTTLMARHLAQWEAAGLVAAVQDPARVTPLERYPHAGNLKTWERVIWTERKSAAYTPEDPPAEAIEIGKTVHKRGRCVFGVDELRALVPVGRPVPQSLMNVFRLWRWIRAPYVGVTTQCVGDLGRALKSVLNFWYIFRLTDDEDRREVERQTGISRDLIAALPQGTALRVTTGF